MKFSILLLLLPILTFSQSYKDEVFTNYFKKDGIGWNAGDGTISVALPDGRTLWLFGDSHVDQFVNSDNQLPCLFNTRNAMMVQNTKNEFSTLYAENGQPLIIKANQANALCWPAGGFVENNTIYLFWSQYAIPDIQFQGMRIAEMSLTDLKLTNVKDFQYPDIAYGMAFVKEATSNYQYIYGRVQDTVWFPNGPLVFYKPLIARFEQGKVYEKNWEFLGENEWSNNPADALPIAAATNNVFSVFKRDQNYYLFYQEMSLLSCQAGKEMYIYTASSPTGPFENRQLVHTIEESDILTYNGQAHPQFNKDGALLVSYNQNKNCPTPCLNPASKFIADHYRPKFLRIDYASFALSTSTKKQALNNSVKIYPTIFNQQLTFKKQDSTPLTILLFDNMGKLIEVVKMTNTIHTLSTHRLGNGIYFYQLIDDTERTIISGKVIKKNTW